MSAREYCGLAFLVVVAFTFPVLLYLLMRIWEFIVDRTFGTPPDLRLRKIPVSVCLAFPVITLLMFVQIGFDRFQRWWVESPYLVSALALFFFGVVPVLLGRMIVRIWRPH